MTLCSGMPTLDQATFWTLCFNCCFLCPSVWGMTEPTALSVGVKTFYLLGNAGSDHLAVSSIPTQISSTPHHIAVYSVPCVWTWSNSDLLHIPSIPYTPILSLLVSITPSCNHSARWEEKPLSCVLETCKHQAECINTHISLLEKEKIHELKQLYSLIAPDQVFATCPRATVSPWVLGHIGTI